MINLQVVTRIVKTKTPIIKLEDKIQQSIGENQQISLPFSLSSISNKKIEVSYTGQDVSTDGGALLLKEMDNRLGLINKIGDCLDDQRDQRYISHHQIEMLKQRVFQIACGYEDGTDCDQLRSDPIFKICADKLPKAVLI